MLIEKIIILSVSILNMFNTTKITKPTKGGNCPTVTKFILQKEVNLLQLHLLQPLIVILVKYIVMLFEAF